MMANDCYCMNNPIFYRSLHGEKKTQACSVLSFHLTHSFIGLLS